MYNKVILIGRLTAQPELIQTSSGKYLTRVIVAVNRRFKTVHVKQILLLLFSGEK